MKKKKLLIDVNSIVPYYVSGKVNGIGRTTLELLQALADIDNLPFEIELYSQNMKGIGDVIQDYILNVLISIYHIGRNGIRYYQSFQYVNGLPDMI